jgi:putative hemolysin
LFMSEFLPGALARRYGDSLLIAVLPAFEFLQRPLQVIVWFLVTLNASILRVLGVERETTETREIVEGLREVIEDSERRNDLNATERELIENVIEFSDVDVAEIMTPRTEIHGVDLEDGIDAVIQIAASEGHSSIPVFEDNLDNIVGYLSARGIVGLLANKKLAEADFRKQLRPVYFVPETKRVTDLLGEFRRGKRKMAIVLDEYGGTAGMVTLGDILGEIVGDIGDEYDRDDPEPVHFLEPGKAVIEASLRIAEVNEAMELELSEEEDYETLGGFVLAEFGRFPRIGESFEIDGTKFQVTDATDRRVLRVEVEVELQAQASSPPSA